MMHRFSTFSYCFFLSLSSQEVNNHLQWINILYTYKCGTISIKSIILETMVKYNTIYLLKFANKKKKTK